MATFIVFTRESTQDQNELNIYLSKVGETLEGHPVKLHAGPRQCSRDRYQSLSQFWNFQPRQPHANGMTARCIRRWRSTVSRGRPIVPFSLKVCN